MVVEGQVARELASSLSPWLWAWPPREAEEDDGVFQTPWPWELARTRSAGAERTASVRSL